MNDESRIEAGYKSPFRNWDEGSSVRSKPARIMEEEPQGKLFFTPELVPVANHPLVKERGHHERILLYHLYAHLDFTENLEHEVVNYITYRIGRRQSGFILQPELIQDAWKLYVDEAYHFKFSADLRHQVERSTGLSGPPMGTPLFLRRLNRLLDQVPSDRRDYVYLFFSIVSETLITGTLNVVPQDQRVISTIREVIGDHAEDEGRHHVYFAHLLRKVWSQIHQDDRKWIGPMIPEFIYGFIEPDRQLNRQWLVHLNYSDKEIERIIEESFPAAKVMHSILDGSKITRKHFIRAGVLDEPYTREAFYKRQLIVEGDLS